jgi:hypothetical protein
MERASVNRSGRSRADSNKYSRNDENRRGRPGRGERSRVWVGGYTRRDGTRVEGHYRNLSE